MLVHSDHKVCSVPARPGAYTFLRDGLEDIQQYKRMMVWNSRLDLAKETFRPTHIMTVEQTKDAEMADAVTSKSPIEEAFDSIADENARKVIAARLTEVSG